MSKPKEPKKVLVSCYFPVAVLELLEAAAEAAGHSRNKEVVERICASFPEAVNPVQPLQSEAAE